MPCLFENKGCSDFKETARDSAAALSILQDGHLIRSLCSMLMKGKKGGETGLGNDWNLLVKLSYVVKLL